MVIVPNTVVRLYSSIPIDPSYRNILLFENEAKQSDYFESQDIIAQFTNFSYVQESGAIRVPINKESLYNVNYISYKNSNFGDKWFYGFVDKIEYLSPNSSAIYFSMDVWQSWCWNLKFLPSFIERETVLDDSIGINTIPENLEYGPVIKNAMNKLPMGIGNVVVLFNKEVPDLTASPTYTNDGYFFGCPFTSFDLDKYDVIMPQIISRVDSETGLEIVNIYTIPSVITSNKLQIPNKIINGYSPRNNKLFTYPYCRAVVSVPGTSKEFRYEDLTSLTVDVHSGRTPSSSVIAKVFSNLENETDNILSFNGYPLISWTNNAYQQWCAEKMQTTLGGQFASWYSKTFYPSESDSDRAYGALAVDWATKSISNPLSTISSAVSGVNEAIGANYLPNKVNNNGCTGETALANGYFGVYASCFSIKPEYAKILDDYFSMYGYKVNRVKRIEIRGRKNWNYVKTIGANISGNCPMDVLSTIKRAFDSGITFWHIPNFDYGDMSNPIE